MKRTIPLTKDMDWLPPRYRALRWTVAGSIWAGMAGLFGTVLIASGGHGGYGLAGFGKFFAVGGALAGDSAARGVLKRRLRRLASGAVDPQRLPAQADGELIHVSGRVRLRSGEHGPESLHGLAAPNERGVWRRTTFSFDGQTRYLDEESLDFLLVGDAGEPIVVETSRAHVLIDDVKPVKLDGRDPAIERLEALPLPATLTKMLDKRRARRATGKKMAKMAVGETFLRDGDEVEILGYKSRTIDPTLAGRLERDTPMRATLRGGQELPLLITRRRS